jgi:hypothetical protein
LNGNVLEIVDVSFMIFSFDRTSLPRLVRSIDLIAWAFLGLTIISKQQLFLLLKCKFCLKFLFDLAVGYRCTYIASQIFLELLLSHHFVDVFFEFGEPIQYNVFELLIVFEITVLERRQVIAIRSIIVLV